MKVDLWFVQCTIVTVNFNLYLLLTYKLPVHYTTFISTTDCGNGTTCLVPVGSLYLGGENTSVSFITGENRTGLWVEGKVPSDGTPITEHKFPYLWITISSYLFASLVILGAIFSMVFTVVFMKRK